MDTSWIIRWDEFTVLLDPWLIGSEVDGFSWFNEQWHTTPPLPIDELPAFDHILVSQSYTDHCHQATLEQLEGDILVTPKAEKRIRKELPDRTLIPLPPAERMDWLAIGDVNVGYLDPGRIMDPIYYGIVLEREGHLIVYTPHGFTLSGGQVELLMSYQVDLLITSFSLFKLPALLGGAVNPGPGNAEALMQLLNPKRVVHTHDENKHARGLVKKIARVQYPDFDHLGREWKDQFVYLDEKYEPYAVTP